MLNGDKSTNFYIFAQNIFCMSFKNKLNNAAIDGLILGAITIVVGLINLYFNNQITRILLWLLKLGLTSYLLYYFMKKFSVENKNIEGSTSYKEVFGYGVLVSFLSNLIIAIYIFISIRLMSESEEVREAIMSQTAGKGMDTPTIDLLMNNIETISAISILLFYTIWGIILSSIFASNTKIQASPFDNNNLNN